MLNSLTTICTRFTKVPCFCPECMGKPADHPPAQPSGDDPEMQALLERGRKRTLEILAEARGEKPAPSPDVAELVRRVRANEKVNRYADVRQLADACERMREALLYCRSFFVNQDCGMIVDRINAALKETV